MALRTGTTYPGTDTGDNTSYTIGITDFDMSPPLTVLFSFKRNNAYYGYQTNREYGIFSIYPTDFNFHYLFFNGYQFRGTGEQYLAYYKNPKAGASEISFGLDNSNFNPDINNAPRIGEWYDVAIVYDGTLSSCKVYTWIGKTGTNDWYFRSADSEVGPDQTSTTYNMGPDPIIGKPTFGTNQGWVDVQIDNIKMWNAVLTRDELLTERRQKRLVRLNNCLLWMPLIDTQASSNLIDMGPATRGMEFGGSGFPTVDYGAPTGWGASPFMIPDFPQSIYSFGYILG